jgi:hypothetical protein
MQLPYDRHKWNPLFAHPGIAGLLYLALAAVFIGYGVQDVVNGKSNWRYGEFTGVTARALGAIKVLCGLGALVAAVVNLARGVQLSLS